MNRSKAGRILSRPGKYILLTVLRVLHKALGLEVDIKANVFFEEEMNVILPASADIYLYGAKTHDSEIRLTKFLINRLKAGSTFIDIGAHFGFYSRLAAKMVAQSGKVFSFEPSSQTFKVFQKNSLNHSNIVALNKAVSNKPGVLTFYEYPTLQSEYNTSKPLENLTESKPLVVQIDAVSIDSEVLPKLRKEADGNVYIKIDVEGAEHDVLLGMNDLIGQLTPVVVIEYFENYPTANYVDCVRFMSSKNYLPFIIDKDGQLKPTVLSPQIAEHTNGLSDNIAFCKAT